MKGRVFIIDTYLVAAGLITGKPESPTAKILDAMLDGSIFYLLSQGLLLEYRNVLLRPKISRLHGLNEDEIDQILVEIAANAIFREPLPSGNLKPPDPNDQHLWALLALEPSAVLVTGDHLLIKNPETRASIITPATWATLFGNTASP